MTDRKGVYVVFGANGMLGSYLTAYFRSVGSVVIGLTRSDLDLDLASLTDIRSTLERLVGPAGKPSYDPETHRIVVINAAGVIRQRSARTAVAGFMRVNAVFPQYLQSAVDGLSHIYRLVHISTDCVFSGKSRQTDDSKTAVSGYVETDRVDEDADPYAVSKRCAELLLLTSPNCCIIRTSMIGEESANGLSLLQWSISKRGQTINGYENHLWNGLTCLQLAETIRTAVEADLLWRGLRHLFSPAAVSKCDLLGLINDAYKLDLTIRPTACATASDLRLSTVESDTDVLLRRIPPLAEQLRRLRIFGLPR